MAELANSLNNDVSTPKVFPVRSGDCVFCVEAKEVFPGGHSSRSSPPPSLFALACTGPL